MHVHHQGRAEYTLIYPGSPPRVETFVRPFQLYPGEGPEGDPEMVPFVGDGLERRGG